MGFHAHEVSLEMVGAVGPVIEAVARRDRALADQMRRAAASVPLNVAEGSRRAGRDRQHCYRIAAGSADELRSALWVAEKWGYVDPSALGSSLDLLDREIAMLWRLARVKP
jgi:four helix bundle protein